MTQETICDNCGEEKPAIELPKQQIMGVTLTEGNFCSIQCVMESIKKSLAKK